MKWTRNIWFLAIFAICALIVGGCGPIQVEVKHKADPIVIDGKVDFGFKGKKKRNGHESGNGIEALDGSDMGAGSSGRSR